MKWSLQELRKIKENQLQFDEVIDLKKSLMERDHEVLDISPVHVTGQLIIEPSDYLVVAHVQAEVTLPSTRSLKPVVVPLAFDFDEMYMTKEQDQNRPEALQDELVLILEKDTIDLVEAVEDQLMLHFPLQVLSEDEKSGGEMPSGEGWEVISEAEFVERKQASEQQTVDPRLAKLSLLLENEDNEE